MKCPFCREEITTFFSMDFCDQSKKHCPRCGKLLPVEIAEHLRPWYSDEPEIREK